MDKFNEIKDYIEKRTDELYDRLPDAGRFENGDVSFSDIMTLGRFNELELLLKHIESLEKIEK